MGKKIGKSIGKIIPGTGFVPNKNYHLFLGEDSQDDITILEYGQYALIETVTKDILDSLRQFFTIDHASQVFAYASILFANDFVHVDQVQTYYEQSWLTQEYRQFYFHMGRTSFGNLLMRYDVNTGLPLFARMYHGACNDKSTIEDIADLIKFSGILFVIDRGFYSAKNLEILALDDNTYIIPVPAHVNTYKEVTQSVKYTDSFYYWFGKKHARIEYMPKRIIFM